MSTQNIVMHFGNMESNGVFSRLSNEWRSQENPGNLMISGHSVGSLNGRGSLSSGVTKAVNETALLTGGGKGCFRGDVALKQLHDSESLLGINLDDYREMTGLYKQNQQVSRWVEDPKKAGRDVVNIAVVTGDTFQTTDYHPQWGFADVLQGLSRALQGAIPKNAKCNISVLVTSPEWQGDQTIAKAANVHDLVSEVQKLDLDNRIMQTLSKRENQPTNKEVRQLLQTLPSNNIQGLTIIDGPEAGQEWNQKQKDTLFAFLNKACELKAS